MHIYLYLKSKFLSVLSFSLKLTFKMSSTSYFNFVLLLTVLFAMEVNSSLKDISVIETFRACFKSVMLKLKESDSSLALLIDPDIDPNVLLALFPIADLSNVPTELNGETLSTSTEHENLVDSTKDSNLLASTETPNSSILSQPKLTPNKQIRYLLFTEENKDKYQIMSKDGSVAGTRWRPERKTKVIIHGLTSAFWSPPMMNIWTQHVFDVKDAYLKKTVNASLYNVIVMDWTSRSTVPLALYPEAALATHDAGFELADFLIKLRESNSILNWGDVHLLGHSLGAHVAGAAGLKLRETGPEYELERITGLDPAGLCFDTDPEKIKDRDTILDSSDAKFVDIIHTNMGNIIASLVGKYGSQLQAGHADFYPNGGSTQNGCTDLQDRMEFCSHQKSMVFYANSIWNGTVACPCSSWKAFHSDNECNCSITTDGQYMGEYCKNTARGKYFLDM